MFNGEYDIHTGDYLVTSSTFQSSHEPRGGWYTDNYQVLLDNVLLPSDILPSPWEVFRNIYPEPHNTRDRSESPSPRQSASQQSSHQEVLPDTIEISPTDGCTTPLEHKPQSPAAATLAPVVSGAPQCHVTRDSSEMPPLVLAVPPSVVVLSETPTHSTLTASLWPTTAQHTPQYIAALEVLQEITRPPELRVISSCKFGNNLTLDAALKMDFSWVHGDIRRDAFPKKTCTAKLAFSLSFAIRQKYQPRKKQVTVITTSNSAIQQPSMGRLAHLVAREMGKYLDECTTRQNPFPYTLDQIILGAVDLVSKGTVQPRLYIQR